MEPANGEGGHRRRPSASVNVDFFFLPRFWCCFVITLSYAVPIAWMCRLPTHLPRGPSLSLSLYYRRIINTKLTRTSPQPATLVIFLGCPLRFLISLFMAFHVVSLSCHTIVPRLVASSIRWCPFTCQIAPAPRPPPLNLTFCHKKDKLMLITMANIRRSLTHNTIIYSNHRWLERRRWIAGVSLWYTHAACSAPSLSMVGHINVGASWWPPTPSPAAAVTVTACAHCARLLCS